MKAMMVKFVFLFSSFVHQLSNQHKLFHRSLYNSSKNTILQIYTRQARGRNEMDHSQERRKHNSPRGCDTFVAYPPTTARGHAVFGKNSDRPSGERQPLRRYPAARHPEGSVLRCTYLSIPQARDTYAVLVSQIDWMWGCEHGANEHGVVIGNEAVWTLVPEEVDDDGTPRKLLLGMDLVRLGLERSQTSREALETISGLLEEHGQGGPCAEDDPSFTYHNSFLIADAREAYVLETAGRHWVAQRWASGHRNISNGLTIRTDFDLSSEGIRDYARQHGLWKDDDGPFDFAAIFSEGGAAGLAGDGRQARGSAMLDRYAESERFDRDGMISILCDRESGICMPAGGFFETTASMVSELFVHDDDDGGGGAKPQQLKQKASNRHWTSGPHPRLTSYSLQEI